MRGIIGAIGIGCAYMLARSVVSLRKGQVKISRMYAWLLRTIVCLPWDTPAKARRLL